MTNNNPRQEETDRRGLESGKLDRELDAALAKYAAVEPRPGIEERILANLRAEREHAKEPSWWRWPVVAALAAVFVVSVSLAWRSSLPSAEITARRPATPFYRDQQDGERMGANNVGSSAHPAAPAAAGPGRHGVRQFHPIIASGPRLDQFPSPQPLSQEEQLLVRYVRSFPQEAVMIAKEQAEFEKQMEKLGGDQPPGTNPDQSEQQER